MATWDGSYPCEDPNYFLYADQNNTPSTPKNWTFFAGNESNTFYHDNRNIYPSTEPIVFEQNMPAVYYQMRADVPSSPSVTSDLGPLSNVCQEALPRADVNVNASNDLQCFPSNIRPRRPVQYFQCNNTKYGKKEKGFKAPKTFPFQSNAEHIVPTLVEQSRLHATANEFVPNISKSKPDGTELQYGHSSVSEGSFGVHIDDSGLKARSSTVNFSDNRSRYDKKNWAYKQRDIQNHMFFRGTMHKNSFRVQNTKECNRMQNDEYYANKHHLNKSYGDIQGGRKRMNRDVAAFQTSSSSHEFCKDGRLLNAHTAIDESKRQACDGTDETNAATKNGIHRIDKARKFNVQRNDGNYFKYNSNNEQSQAPRRGMRKNVVNNKMDKYDKDYKEKRKDNSNSKFNYDKQVKPDRIKDKGKSKDITPDMKDRDNFSWRRKAESNDKGGMLRQSKKNEIDDDASQRERLTEQLNRGQLECLVCCEYIKQIDYIWSCSNCYHVLHLDCIKKWAKSSHSENGWRCPACQNVSSFIPEKYFCFCGKTRSPEWNRRDVAHSCGEICGRSRKTNCAHKCTLLCHPGSCPVCTAMVTKFCGCTRSSQTLQCSDLTLLHCDAVCAKTLNCEKHACEKKCHHGDCGSCDEKLEQECYCGKQKREITCQPNVSLKYSCNSTCDKLLDCGNHRCQKICHLDSCDPCSLTPEKVTTCCCGQSPLTEKRNSCLDAISTCDKICSKRLACGQPNNPHTCKVVCHTGECPDCEFTTDVKCRCGNMDREIVCKELTTKADDARCEKKCTKKRSCGKHKCNQLCCIDIEHICPLPCLKTLSCGKHKCEQSCHKGRCLPCWHSSFEELYCECGAAVTYPPVPCGTRRPVCNQPCSREHACGHEVLHNCHSDSMCPPCTVLTQKWCYGKHELRKAVPCYVNEISCGLPCSKPLSCGRHKCITICHPGSCEKPGQICVQPCVIPRELCGHICSAPCHEGECPDAPCKEMVKVTCQCGHRSMTRACAENSREYQRIASSILASKMADMQLGHSVDLEEVFGQGAKKQNQLKTLECNDECKLIERNRRLALGLQIVNPDLSGKLMPRYSEFMKHWAKKDAHFCQMVHDKLTELVQLAKTSKQKSRSYSFDSMNRDKRHFVHESCEHFGCESQAYDLEPKRNVVATAVKDKCWLPSYSLLEIVQRENGQRKVPGPMLNPSKGNSTIKTVLSLPIKKNQKITAVPTTSRSPEPEIDYFDYQG